MQKMMRTMRRAVLSKLLEHLREHYGLDWLPEAPGEGVLTVHQIDAAIAFKSDLVLDELRSALNRLDEGTFGVCINCKGPISEDILHVDPTQRLCPDCERALMHTMPLSLENRLNLVQ